jgi:hypothetical protein
MEDDLGLGPLPDDDIDISEPEPLNGSPFQIFLSHTWPDHAFLQREVVKSSRFQFFMLNYMSAMDPRSKLSTSAASCAPCREVVGLSWRSLRQRCSRLG